MSAARVLILDTLYQEFIAINPLNPAMSYQGNLDALLFQSFGTFDAFSRHLTAFGFECRDVIVNHVQLQNLWASENGNPKDILAAQIADFQPDIIFLQNLSIQLPPTKALVVGQCSCAFPRERFTKQCSVIFTSIPSHVAKIEALGIKAIFLPLAFDPAVLGRTNPCAFCKGRGYFDMAVDYEPYVQGSNCRNCSGTGYEPMDRIHDVVFIGGVGNPSHWRQGMQTLEAVAREIPTFKWWGYGHDSLPANSALRDKYQGEAFGLDMYRIMLQSKIVLNRHGEVAQGAMNNLRNFEATGCGAMLLTEATPTVDLFDFSEVVFYNSPREAVACITDFLIHDDVRERFAKNGQKRTLRDHTYAQRMKTVSDVLTGMLCPTGSA